jgi:hypothetical protein
MIDEEQSGVGYPVRPFGLLSQKPLPSFVSTHDGLPSRIARLFGPTLPADKKAFALAERRIRAAASGAFNRLHTLYPTIPYRGGSAPAFTSSDVSYLHIGPTSVCCSDNDAFEALGLPTVTYVGNSDYYSKVAQPWSYPFDQPQDTPAALACDTGGSPQPGRALEAALDLPLLMSQLLVDAYATPARGHGLAVFSTIPDAGRRVRFSAAGSSRLTWDFGDGSHATGSAPSHTYRRAGVYRITVQSDTGAATLRTTVSGGRHYFSSPALFSPPPLRAWQPPQLQNIPGCH